MAMNRQGWILVAGTVLVTITVAVNKEGLVTTTYGSSGIEETTTLLKGDYYFAAAEIGQVARWSAYAALVLNAVGATYVFIIGGTHDVVVALALATTIVFAAVTSYYTMSIYSDNDDKEHIKTKYKAQFYLTFATGIAAACAGGIETYFGCNANIKHGFNTNLERGLL